MESLDLTYKLFDLKILKSLRKAPDQIYFMSQVFQEQSHCYDKRKKKLLKSILFLPPPFPSQDGGGGPEVVATPPPPPANFFDGKNF